MIDDSSHAASAAATGLASRGNCSSIDAGKLVVLVFKIMYGGKIMNLITSSFCRAVARHSAPRARPGDAESTDLSAYRAFRPFKFEFHAWVLAEDDRCVERRM